MTTEVLSKKIVPLWAQVMPMALCVTVGLFLLMQRLISTEYVELVEPSPVVLPDVHWEDPPIVEFIDKRAKKPEPPEVEPPAPPEPWPANHSSAIEIPEVAVNKHVSVGSGGIDYRMPVPQVMVSPKYPVSAINRGVEGYVDVRFDISEKGLTENITILGANPEGVFESVALNAVSRWRYLPQLDDGKAVPFHGMTQRLRFEIDKE